ncbi:glutamate 5-kinase [Acidihalobacter ferrooxydans]|uniref:Glutamate 5-kinase n=1 Tax=Acidihalobacter ferrooxydans TaxID=1765967 RepID=A0A1P8UD51_9GAMM|nr:glutamate 5-kinase [Acidihalobacter ferrooxydans]APZ41723.1 glutamate 5-kinase [Acidihalobacter ferrooxydans]
MRKPARRWVVKIGSSLLTNDGRGLDLPALADWSTQIAHLRAAGLDVVLVSSGAVAAGMSRLGWSVRPRELQQLQAAAAIGQMSLVQAYQDQFARHGLLAAQVLLTHDDLISRRRYLNARSTLRALLELGAVPIVNENDTVAADEIRLGDNDTLGALVANLIEAERLAILTDQQGLYDSDPRQHPEAQLIPSAQASDPRLADFAATGKGVLGRGGMATKVAAAKRAARSGAETVIVSGRQPQVLERLAAGEAIGTLLRPDDEPLAARKQWIASQLSLHGYVVVDEGAAHVLQQAGRSLLPIGVTDVQGRFVRGEVVSVRDPTGREIARGLCNYDADETRRIMRKPSDAIEETLGYVDEPELIHRDNLVLM